VQLRQVDYTNLAKDDLWSEIFGRTTQRPRPAFYTFGKTKICDLQKYQERKIHVRFTIYNKLPDVAAQ